MNNFLKNMASGLNVQQLLTNQLMNQLKNKNPQAYNFLLQAQSSGKEPQQILEELTKNGTFTQSQVKQAQEQVNSMLNNGNGSKAVNNANNNPLRR